MIDLIMLILYAILGVIAAVSIIWIIFCTCAYSLKDTWQKINEMEQKDKDT